MSRINNKKDISKVVQAKKNTNILFEIKGKVCSTIIVYNPSTKNKYSVNIGGAISSTKTKGEIVDKIYKELSKRGWKETISLKPLSI